MPYYIQDHDITSIKNWPDFPTMTWNRKKVELKIEKPLASDVQKNRLSRGNSFIKICVISWLKYMKRNNILMIFVFFWIYSKDCGDSFTSKEFIQAAKEYLNQREKPTTIKFLIQDSESVMKEISL